MVKLDDGATVRGWRSILLPTGCVLAGFIGGVFAGISFGKVRDGNGADLTNAVIALVIRFTNGVTPSLVLGLAAAWLAARSFRAFDHDDPPFGVTSRWGGLGSGEGGWELDGATVRWGLRVFGILALSFVAVWLVAVPAPAADVRPELTTVSGAVGGASNGAGSMVGNGGASSSPSGSGGTGTTGGLLPRAGEPSADGAGASDGER